MAKVKFKVMQSSLLCRPLPHTYLTEQAVSSAENDCERLAARKAREEQDITAEVLKDMHEQAQEMIDVECSELNMIKQQCSTDRNTVGE